MSNVTINTENLLPKIVYLCYIFSILFGGLSMLAVFIALFSYHGESQLVQQHYRYQMKVFISTFTQFVAMILIVVTWSYYHGLSFATIIFSFLVGCSWAIYVIFSCINQSVKGLQALDRGEPPRASKRPQLKKSVHNKQRVTPSL